MHKKLNVLPSKLRPITFYIYVSNFKALGAIIKKSKNIDRSPNIKLNSTINRFMTA